MHSLSALTAALKRVHESRQDPEPYPTYHSIYDTYLLASKLMDRGFRYHQAIGKITGLLLLRLADAVVLPFDVQNYVTYLTRATENVEALYGNVLEANNATLS